MPMRKNIKFYDTDKIDLRDERTINEVLRKEGMYSKSHMFPIASLQFELTTHCNVFCKHCYNNSGICNDIPDLMTSEKWIEFAKYLVEHGGIFECILSGGEPLLLGEALFEVMDILHDDGTCFMLLTNGYLLSEERVERLRKYRYHWVQISIDSVNSEYHDSFRKRKDSWKKAVAGAIKVSKSGMPLKIAHCVTRYNINEIDNMCEFAYLLGASCITVGELCLSGRVAQNKDLLLSSTERQQLRIKVQENAAKYRGRMKVKTSNGIQFGLKRHKKRPNSSAIIRPNGDIRIDGMAPFIIGNILTDDFANVWKEKINTCWDNPKVIEYISQFEDDRNNTFINYIEDDIYI